MGPNVENVNSASFYSKEHAIATDNHLTNLDGKLVVFWRKREALGNKRELTDNCFS
jgi:hypothetical protein